MMSERLIVLASFPDPFKAEVAKARLEAIGIECVMEELETTEAPLPTSQGMTGVRIKVRIVDYERAREALGEPAEETSASVPHCPNCGSTNVISDEGFIVRLKSTVFGKSGRRRCRCLDCEYCWMEE